MIGRMLLRWFGIAGACVACVSIVPGVSTPDGTGAAEDVSDSPSAGTSGTLRDRFSFASPDFFPILPWDPQHGWKSPFSSKRARGLPSIAECGFTMAGFVRPEDLPECERLGLAAIVLTDSGLINGKEFRKLSDADIDRLMKRAVEQTRNSPAVMGYFITDEPGASDFPFLAKAVEAVRRLAPGKLAYINLFPDYASLGARNASQLETETYAEYLERFVTEVKPQFISYDNYMVQYSLDLKDAGKAASYYRNLLEVRRVALAHGLPFWNIVSSNQIRSFTTIPSPANLQFQAYTTLAAGGRGVSWYTYYGGGYSYAPVDSTDYLTLTWHSLREVNRQIAVIGPVMNRLTSTGVFFTPPPPADGLPVLPGKLVSEAVSDAPMMTGEFTDETGAGYVMAVNLSLERSARFSLKPGAPRTLEFLSAEDGSWRPMDSSAGLWLTAGQGVLVRLR